MTKLKEILPQYDTIFFDVWGVVVEAGSTYPGVVDVINGIIASGTKNVLFVSNAPRPCFAAAQTLVSLGVNVTPDMFVTSGDLTRSLLTTGNASIRANPKIYHIGADRNEDILKDLDVQTTENIENADVILLTAYRDEGEDLLEFDEILKCGAERDLYVICANPDTILANSGKTRYCAGYFAAQYQGNVIYTGKPYLEIFKFALGKLADKIGSAADKSRILMVGDTIEMDIKGANGIGIDSALVITGNAGVLVSHFSEQDRYHQLELICENIGIIPTHIISMV